MNVPGALFEEHFPNAKGYAVGQKKQLTFRGNVTQGRYGWLRLTPAYSLHIVQEILSDAPRGALVLEPFSGTGTTPLACARKRFECHALDINPFLVWLGNLKLKHFSARSVDEFLRGTEKLSKEAPAASDDHWLPDIHQIEKWWDHDVLEALGKIFSRIQHSDSVPDRLRDLIRLAFCRLLIGTANVSFGHQSMSFKKKPEKVSVGLFEAPPLDCYSLFLDAAQDLGASLQEPLARHKCKVLLGDAREVNGHLPQGRTYDLVITSPPYPNRMSYIRELRPYMYWLGFLTNGRDAGKLDWKAIGGTWGCATSLLGSWTPDTHYEVPYEGFPDIIRQISEGHHLLGPYVHKYFCDTVQHIRNLVPVLSRGATCHYIVGNSKFYDTLLPTQQIYASIFRTEGFSPVDVTTLRKRTSKKELYEYVVKAVRP